MATTVRAHLRIKGKVQGVFYRQSAKTCADRLGVRGWVRNLEEGDVEAVAEGSDAALSAFIEWCHQGPPGARVDEVQVAWDQAPAAFANFQVER